MKPTIPQLCGDLDAIAWRATYARLHRTRIRRRRTYLTLAAVVVGAVAVFAAAAWAGEKRVVAMVMESGHE